MFDKFLIFVEVFENLSIRTKIGVPDKGFVFDDRCLEGLPVLVNQRSNSESFKTEFLNHKIVLVFVQNMSCVVLRKTTVQLDYNDHFYNEFITTTNKICGITWSQVVTL